MFTLTQGGRLESTGHRYYFNLHKLQIQVLLSAIVYNPPTPNISDILFPELLALRTYFWCRRARLRVEDTPSRWNFHMMEVPQRRHKVCCVLASAQTTILLIAIWTKKQTRSCDRCRIKKRKCSGGSLCLNCLEAGTLCTMIVKQKKRGPKKGTVRAKNQIMQMSGNTPAPPVPAAVVK